MRNIADILKETGKEQSVEVNEINEQNTTLDVPITFNSRVTGINRLIKRRNKLSRKREHLLEKIDNLQEKVSDLSLAISIIDKALET